MSEPDRPPGSGLEIFHAVYEREFDYVWRNLGRMGVPHGEIADAVHEVFIVLHRRWNDLDHGRSLRPWLFGVARRVASDLRAKRREQPTDVEPPAVEDPRIAERDLLWRALAMLDEDRRTVIILHDLEGHTGAEIAAQLDMSVNTVHSRLRLARADLLAAVRKLRGAR
ncbi:MAG: sigma-70 family RNA polymerase sigma factor [Kofleriaceae bacterium]|nr:sigma-70 family RNA polymerase sigma factor [Kofleriaceae bacterium]